MTREGILSVFPELLQIRDKTLCERCADAWILALKESETSDEEFLSVLCHKSLADCPVTLAEHTRGVTRLAISVAERFIEDFSRFVPLDMDEVIAAACLHDVGKLYEHMRDETAGKILDITEITPHAPSDSRGSKRSSLPQ